MSQLRIGDAERDAAAAALGEHYAAGRLTKEEYDERVDQVWAARFDADLRPVFADLPRQASAVDRPARALQAAPRTRPPAWAMPFMWVAPALLVALVAIVIITGMPWLLFILFWFFVFGGFGRHHRQWSQHRHQHGHWAHHSQHHRGWGGSRG